MGGGVAQGGNGGGQMGDATHSIVHQGFGWGWIQTTRPHTDVLSCHGCYGNPGLGAGRVFARGSGGGVPAQQGTRAQAATGGEAVNATKVGISNPKRTCYGGLPQRHGAGGAVAGGDFKKQNKNGESRVTTGQTSTSEMPSSTGSAGDSTAARCAASWRAQTSRRIESVVPSRCLTL